MQYNSFEELIVWQKAIDLVEKTYCLFKLLPKEENYALIDQMRRSAISIPSNIAEGQQRGTAKEFAYFLSVAKGSAGELWTQIRICERLRYLTEEDTKVVKILISQIKKMIDGLMDTLK